MSAPVLSSGAQLRYILQWFAEFSELQREDFLPILAAAKEGQVDELAAALAALSCQDKPVSLFQCRIKLFNEWYPTWGQEDKERLIKGVSEIDEDFAKKLGEALASEPRVNGDMTNGDHAADDEEDFDVSNSQEVIAAAPEDNGDQVSGDAIAESNIPIEIAAA